MIEVDTLLEGYDGVGSAVIRAAEAALAYTGEKGDIAFSLVDDPSIHEMNRRFRHVDRPTDVLSFPAREGAAIPGFPDDSLGDIAISLPTAVRQAEAYGHSLEREISFLAIHGTLHLLGYDHMTEEDKREMFRLQDEILEEMRMPR